MANPPNAATMIVNESLVKLARVTMAMLIKKTFAVQGDAARAFEGFGRKMNADFDKTIAKTSIVVPDKQGRILVPAYLKSYANIKKEIMLIGVSNRIEIWSRENWKQFYAASKESYEDVAEQLMDLE